ncbi:hypothetical protein PILCRDRAFT_13006 [Piloderma croceum F 1598]|uniref:Nephrocystin 3-like N-terminal domain-containing protein n=1 Tax=Piloderma croceum (strain F 1598) TaxID=765440 RepID=A0A0C3F8U0_PILCF|nr:hypothetical protein PILCRDRAFT_13006 [Piloderma croceum F 1598]
MSRWTIDHPATTLDRVLDNICAGIDNRKDLLELIPDSPFPARSLVTGLGYLVKLGASVSRAKSEVQKFAKNVIQWVGDMQYYFRLIKRTDELCVESVILSALIDEICIWATARLNDGRWSSISHGLSIAQEIDEFKSRIESARALFLDLSVINLAQGLDAIIREIDGVRKLQQDQLQNINDKLDAQNQAKARRQFLANMLNTHTVTNATYDKQGKQPCDANTRTAILADIDTWMHDFSGDCQNFLWLTGDPGSGKSAITASVAKKCKNDGTLWAQFFINRNNADTTDPKSYFPSIARQLIDRMPDSDVAVAIYGALQNKCAIVDDISIEQASKLFVDAIEVASKLNSEKAVVVVIGGLDETNRSRLRLTAGIFAELFAKLRCRNAKVFISSRTEDDIQKPFSKAFDVRHVKHIHLDTSTQASIQDVSYFLAKRIGEIVENNDLNWEEWPGMERMEILCIRASGLFIWAATVVKFFQEQINTLGRECLNDLLDDVSTDGMDDINALYGAILRIVYKGRKSDWEFETFRRVVGCIVVLQEPLCLAKIENLLDLRQNASSECVDIQHLVRRLRTVLVPGTDAINDQTIPRLHKSFFEFITSERADRRFRINCNISNGELAVQCLRQLTGLRDKHTSLSENYSAEAVGSLPAAFGYAIQLGSWHLLEEKGVMVGMAIIGCTVQLPKLQQLLRFSTDDLRCSGPLSVTLSADGTQIFTGQFYATQGVLSVAFSPDGKHIASGSDDETVRIWDSQSWKSIGAPFIGHTDRVWSVAFSPDGKRIASGSFDKTVRIWDSQSGKSIGTPFIGHTNLVRAVTFSPDGKRIASGSADTTIRIWDSQSGKSIGTPFIGHTESLWSVAFSPDGKHIASGSGDKTVCIWDSQSGQPIGSSFIGHTVCKDKTVRIWHSTSGESIGTLFIGHTGFVGAVTFSPDGKRIASGSDDKTVRIWNSHSGESIGTPFIGHTDLVRAVTFSPDGKRIASGSDDKTVRIWDSQNGQLIGPLFRSHGEVRSVALSPDATDLICVSLDSVRFWDLRTGLAMEMSLEGDSRDIAAISISRDGSRIAAASLNGTIYLWDATTRRLVSPPIDSPIGGFKSLKFSSDNTRLILACIDGGTCLWNSTDGKPIRTALSSDSFLSENKKVMSFNMKDGWRSGEFEDSLLRWLPSDDSNSGVWAYVDGKVIGGLGDGSVTIIDLDDIKPNQSVSV